ncbi:MAG: hypothetical protein E7394_01445 [Ruminococcaceae bacterium]|nr:hypothetical protein [Oscillospiraceae bacterium]
MKKVFLVLFCFMFLFVFSGCHKEEPDAKDKRVLDAIEILCDHWDKSYEDSDIDDKYVEITNTQIINIKDKIDKDVSKREIFEDVDYIVEFDIISNLFDTSPYYYNVCTDNITVL